MPIEAVVSVPELSSHHLRVFRRYLAGTDTLEELEVDAYVLLSERYAIVCDTLLCPEDAEAMLEMIHSELQGRSLLVINSHADWDHTWGNCYFTDAHAVPLLAHEKCYTRLCSPQAQAELDDYQHRSPVFRHVKLTPPTITFRQRMVLHGGDITVELFTTPGHYHDHIAAWIPELRLLLAFDAVEKPLPLIENAAAVPSMFATLEMLQRFPAEHVLCSHGKSTGKTIIQHNLAYLRSVEQCCREFLATAHTRTDPADLAQASLLIDYPFDKVVASSLQPEDEINRTFYTWAHNHNARCLLEWLMNTLD